MTRISNYLYRKIGTKSLRAFILRPFNKLLAEKSDNLKKTIPMEDLVWFCIEGGNNLRKNNDSQYKESVKTRNVTAKHVQ